MGEQGTQHRCLIGQRGKGILGQVGVLGLGILMVEPPHTQSLQLVTAVGGSQQIGRQSRIKDKAASLDALVQQSGQQGFHIVGVLLDVRSKEGFQNAVIPLQLVSPENGGVAILLTLPVLHHNHVQRGQGQHIHAVFLPPDRQQLLCPVQIGDIFTGAGAGKLFLLLHLP